MKWRVWIEARSGKFLVRCRSSEGDNLKPKLCTTKSIANQVKKKWEDEIEHKALGLSNPNKELEVAYDEYLQEMSAGPENTLATIKSVIPKYTKGKSAISDLTRQSIVDWRTTLFKTMKPATIKKHLRHLGAFLSWLVRQGYMDESPFKNIDVPNPKPIPRAMYDHELIALDRAARGDLRLMLRIAYTTGMRQANTLGIHGEWIQGDQILVPRTKSQVSHPYPIHPVLVATLLARKPKRGPIFQGWTRYKLRHAYDDLKVHAGVRKEVTWHALKHTFIKMALQSGLSKPEVQQMAGNLSSQSMDPYTVFEQSGLRVRHRLIRFPRLVGR